MKTIALVLGSLLFVGCANDPNDVSFRSIRGDLTPELMGMTERGVDVQRAVAVTNNQNARMFWGDLGRVFHTDHSSRLSPFPVLDTSGQPR